MPPGGGDTEGHPHDEKPQREPEQSTGETTSTAPTTKKKKRGSSFACCASKPQQEPAEAEEQAATEEHEEAAQNDGVEARDEEPTATEWQEEAQVESEEGTSAPAQGAATEEGAPPLLAAAPTGDAGDYGAEFRRLDAQQKGYLDLEDIVRACICALLSNQRGG